MTPHEPTSLDSEERALAQRLARLGPHGEPAPALDSRVLAAAHAAVAGHRRTSRQGSRRWPLGLGVAASLALALGLAWQLRPLPDAAPAYRSEADSALRPAPAAAGTASQGTEPVFPPPPAETAAADSVQRELPVAEPPPAPPSASAEKIPAPASQPVPPAPQETPIVFDAPGSAQATQAAMQGKAAESSARRAADASAAIAAPAPAGAPQAFATPRAAADAGSAPSPSAERAPTPAAAMQPESTRQKVAVPATAPAEPSATSAGEDMPIDDVPPATVASPQVRDAWLARIRELAADGDIEDARASLREFQHRYPDYPLPQDLRALLP